MAETEICGAPGIEGRRCTHPQGHGPLPQGPSGRAEHGDGEATWSSYEFIFSPEALGCGEGQDSGVRLCAYHRRMAQEATDG